MTQHTRYLLGAMTGTSLDGLDLALVKVQAAGVSLRAELVDHLSHPLGDLTSVLTMLASGQAVKPLVWLEAGRAFGELHVHAIRTMLSRHPQMAVDFLVAHGQTLWHSPECGVSWQLFDPWPVVQAFGMAVCYDLRQADLSASGQGAPITPLSDLVMFGDPQRHRLIVNLGGICNITDLPTAAAADATLVTASDIGPCNLLIDGMVRRAFAGENYDADGKLSAMGEPTDLLVQAVADNLFFKRGLPRTAGREDFSNQWLDGVYQQFHGRVSPHDLVAAAVEAVALQIAAAARAACPDEIVLAGGGALNATLVKRIGVHGGAKVMLSDAFGVPVQAREAMAMTVLGALLRDGVGITLPQVTGAGKSAALAGVWVYPKPRTVSTQPRDDATEKAVGRGDLLTEQRLDASDDLDAKSIGETLAIINEQDASVASVVRQAIPDLSQLIEHVVLKLRDGGRLIYLGAGTSGRLGVLDASECPPTFFSDPQQVIGLIAGGDGALRKSSEGMEDDPHGACASLDALRIGRDDVVIGIAAGGTTPYVRGGVQYAKTKNSITALVCCVTSNQLSHTADIDHLICLPTGPEVVTGSTRMKAGTATKLALNMITTTAMAKLGKIYGNLMVDLKASNTKLIDRAVRIIMSQTALSPPAARQLLDAAGGRVKLALVMARCEVDLKQATALLQAHDDNLRAVIGPPMARR